MSVLCLLDLCAAFDTVDLDLLWQRLERQFGLCGTALQWVRSYLSGKTFRVVFGDVMSFIVYVMCSGPQGSVLGPLFFILYMADLADWVAKCGVSLHGYADDTQLYLHFNRTEIASSVDHILTSGQVLVRRTIQWTARTVPGRPHRAGQVATDTFLSSSPHSSVSITTSTGTRLTPTLSIGSSLSCQFSAAGLYAAAATVNSSSKRSSTNFSTSFDNQNDDVNSARFDVDLDAIRRRIQPSLSADRRRQLIDHPAAVSPDNVLEAFPVDSGIVRHVLPTRTASIESTNSRRK